MKFIDHEKIISVIKHWVETSVIELNLCPFAKREFVNQRIRFSVSDADTEQQLLSALQTELELLNSDDSIETTLLIHPHVLQRFSDYNEFLDLADGLLIQMELGGIIQIASFHPDYQFSKTDIDDAENYSNRSPFPLLHLLKEESLDRVITNYPEIDKIPERNIELLQNLGRDKMEALFQSHFNSLNKK